MVRNEWFLNIIGLMALMIIIMIIMSLNPAVGRELVIASTYNDGTRDPTGMTAAHPTLKHGTRLTVSHGHRKVMITINDTGPAPWTKRKLDLTPAVNKYLQCGGLCRVVIEPWPPLPQPRPDDVIAWGEE